MSEVMYGAQRFNKETHVIELANWGYCYQFYFWGWNDWVNTILPQADSTRATVAIFRIKHKSHHMTTTTLTIGYTDEDEPIDYVVQYNIDGGYVPECKWLRNGDPGYPQEDAEIELVSVRDESGEVELTRAMQKLIESKIWEAELSEVD